MSTEIPKILIVDNELEICNLFKDFFDFIGYESSFETDGQIILDDLENREYDILFVDLKLPTISGIDILRKSKQVHPLSEVIVVTGFGSEETVLTTYQSGASSYIQKPISFSDIRIQTEQALSRRRFNIITHRLCEAVSGDPVLKKHLEMMNHLERMSKFLSLTIDIDMLGDAILNGLASLLDTRYFTFLFYDKINSEIIVYSADPLSDKKVTALEAKTKNAFETFISKSILETFTVRISRSSQVDPALDDEIDENLPQLFVPILIDNTVKGVIGLVGFEEERRIHYQDIMHIVSGRSANVVANATIHRDTKMLALTDGLTGLLNHRAFHDRLRQEFERFRRYGVNLSLIVADFDNLKTVNDTYGHPVGDDVLRMVGEILRDASRETDILARYGGDEFVILLPQTSVSNARNMADRILIRIRNHVFHVQDNEFTSSLSMGIATVPHDGVNTPQDFLECADRALYEAKHGGKNQIVVVHERC